MTRLVKIYVLRDPITLGVRYVGATSQKLNRRLTGHVWDARHLRGTRKVNWIRTLLQKNLCPIIELIEVCENWQEREKFWYDFYKDQVILVNTNIVGTGVHKKNKDSIERSSQAKFKPIVQCDLQGVPLKEWLCIRDATIDLKLARNSIKNCLKGRCSSSGGFRWKYKGDKKFASTRKPGPIKKVLLICSSGEIIPFKSVNSCAIYLKVSVNTIHRKLQDGILNEDIVRSSKKLGVNKTGRS